MIANLAASLFCGGLFGAGLALSGMMNPQKVLGFLTLNENWDPSLAFVLVAALTPSILAYRLRSHLQRPLLEEGFHIPQSTVIDRRLIGGAAIFGLGWGLVGLCPGPAIAALSTGRWEAIVFFMAMVAGILLFRLFSKIARYNAVRVNKRTKDAVTL
ncbi:DUF6691 family protein [Allorhizobium undicola]|uniref:DUF6691 family protein n=1 Tax=Allorhizobium undicola TaxID=78527 RepID=UPI00047FA73B|nr:DUF6691 family protein [Allorhizobium undicola]